jgi:hypothetical protein
MNASQTLNRTGTVARDHTLNLAVLLAGRRRSALRAEWRAHLMGDRDHDSVTWGNVRQALGLTAAASRFRLADAATLAWRPADALLRSRALSNLFVCIPVIVTVVVIVRHDSPFGLGLVNNIEGSAALGASLYGVIRIGRWWRAITLPRPKARRGRAERVPPSAGALLAVIAWLLPTADRAQYVEEFRSELWEIVEAGGGRRAQLAYALRQALSAFQLRRELRKPRQHGAAP